MVWLRRWLVEVEVAGGGVSSSGSSLCPAYPLSVATLICFLHLEGLLPWRHFFRSVDTGAPSPSCLEFRVLLVVDCRSWRLTVVLGPVSHPRASGLPRRHPLTGADLCNFWCNVDFGGGDFVLTGGPVTRLVVRLSAHGVGSTLGAMVFSFGCDQSFGLGVDPLRSREELSSTVGGPLEFFQILAVRWSSHRLSLSGVSWASSQTCRYSFGRRLSSSGRLCTVRRRCGGSIYVLVDY